MNWLNFSGRGRMPAFVQSEAAECGLACLAMIASFHGRRTDLGSLRRRFPVSMKGMTLRGLMQLAGHLGLSSRAIRFELGHLSQLKLPAVVHWDLNHFVVLKKVMRRAVVVNDPAVGERRYPIEEASKHLTGVAVELTPTEAFESKDERTRLPLSAFWGHLDGAAHALVQVLVLSAVLEVLVIASPFYIQLAVDEVIARGDADFLTVLAIGFTLVGILTVVSTYLRSYVALVLQNTLHFQMGARLFHHLIRLPLTFFEKRHIGDVLSRFGSIEPIRNLLAEGAITGVIDGVMAIATLVMIFLYSPLLASIVLVSVGAYATLRMAFFPVLRARSDAVIRSKARENSSFIETARAIQSIKLFNREDEREGQWLNRYADVINANVRLGRLQISFKTMNDAIFGIENIVVVYVAARLALESTMTVGMIFAFMSYKRNFTDKMVLLVEKVLDFRILGLHLERLADIALTSTERVGGAVGFGQSFIEGRIEMRDVSFRYSETDPLILENVNLTIEPGEFVTFSGPSGGGKTTLVKLILGLLQPTSGEVRIDGKPLSVLGLHSFREHVAAVMQEDQLLSGSIADNICFFDSSFDQDRMIASARIARVHDEIMAMSMGYNTLIGDMGSSLSGGQKQRVLLARALYRQPRILVLDEGTAHLDVETERQINLSLRDLSITRISVAHRPDMMAGTSRTIHVGNVAEIAGRGL